jgi:hypothetical protein
MQRDTSRRDAVGGEAPRGPRSTASNLDSAREVGAYTARILKGERAGNLPVIQSAKFETHHQYQLCNATLSGALFGCDLLPRLRANKNALSKRVQKKT